MAKLLRPEKYDLSLRNALNTAGGPTALAEHLGVLPSAVVQWNRAPPRHVLAIESFTGVSRHDLRPDIYGPATDNEPVVLTPTVSEATPHTECCSAPVAPPEAPAPEATPPAQPPSAQPLPPPADEPAHHHEQGEAA